jgi:hypothetical protein
MKDSSPGGEEGWSHPRGVALTPDRMAEEAVKVADAAAETAAATAGGLPNSYALRCVRTCSGYVRGGEKKGLSGPAALARAIKILVEDEDGHVTAGEARAWMAAWSGYLLALEEGV